MREGSCLMLERVPDARHPGAALEVVADPLLV